MSSSLSGRTIAILATNGVEQVELTVPREALQDAGATVVVVSLQPGTFQGMNKSEKGDAIAVDRTLADVAAADFDGLLLPGGVANPDTLRADEQAVGFVKGFVEAGKPIASICHGPWTLLEAGGVKGRRLTSWPSLRTDLQNGGANWVDEQVVRDGPLVTSRKPDDLPAFNKAMVELFANSGDAKRAA